MHSLLVQLCTPRQEQSKPSSTNAHPQSPAVPRRIHKAQTANLPHRQGVLLPTSPVRSDAVFATHFFFLAFFSALFSRCFPAADYSHRRDWILCSPPSSSTVLRPTDGVGVAAPKSLLLQHSLLAEQGGICGYFQNL